MARWRRVAPPEMPEHLAAFRLADWCDAAGLDGEVDPWEVRKWYNRPADPVALEAYQRFRDARASWEAEHPEWTRREIADHIARRLERAARWTRQEENRDDTNRGA